MNKSRTVTYFSNIGKRQQTPTNARGRLPLRSGGWRKYRNIPTGGRRSKLEARYEDELKLRVLAGELVSYRYEQPIKLIVGGVLICTYKVDWTLEYPDGHIQYVETKGFETDLWRFKWRLMQALHPDWDMVVKKDKDVR